MTNKGIRFSIIYYHDNIIEDREMKKDLFKMILALCLEGFVIITIITYVAYKQGMEIASPFIRYILGQ